MSLLTTKNEKDAALEDKIPRLIKSLKNLRSKEKGLERQKNQKRLRIARIKPGERAAAQREVANIEGTLDAIEQKKHEIRALINEQLDKL